MMDPEGFYPQYLKNACWLQCEYSAARHKSGQNKNADLGPAAFNDDSFCYLPWEIHDEQEGLAFVEAYRQLNVDQRDQDLTVTIGGEPRVLRRVRLSPQAWSPDDPRIAPAVPIIIEWPGVGHAYPNALYSDGTRARLDAGHPYPWTERLIRGLRAIASLDKPGLQ